MTSNGGRNTLVVLGVLLLTLLIVVALIPVRVPDQAGAAAILPMATAGAVVIERALEGFWTMVGTSRLGNWWPPKPIGERLNTFIDQLNKPLTDFHQEAQARVGGAGEAAENLSPWLEDANDYLGELETNTRKLQQLAPGDGEARAICRQGVKPQIRWFCTSKP